MTGYAKIVALCVGLAGAACSDALDQGTTAGQAVIVVNAGSGDVTLLEVTRLTSTSFTLAPGNPTGVATRGLDLIVAIGGSDAIQTGNTSGAGPVIQLASGSGATGLAIQDDSIVWVANPGLNTVTRVNYRTGDTGSVAVGADPRDVVIAGTRLFVLNANAPMGAPAGPSWLSARNLADPLAGAASDSVGLSGTNARFAALGVDGFIYVVASGTPGAADGRLSVIDAATSREVVVINGLGEVPGRAVYHPSGRLLIASGSGILEVRTTTRALERGPDNAIKPDGAGVDALVVDSRGRVYAVAAGDCSGPGTLYVLGPPPDYQLIESLPVGVCPRAAALAALD